MQQTQTLSKMWATTQNHNCCHDALLENTTAHLFFVPLENHYFVFSSSYTHQIAVQARGTVDKKKILGWVAFFGILEKILFFLAIIAFVSDNWMSSTF